MTELIKQLCMLDGTSGDEKTVREFIIEQIKPFCEYNVDNLGNIIAFKKGENRPSKKIMLDAHTDEVGFIITGITAEGFLKFSTVGGINTAVLTNRRVVINGETMGAIGMRPVHLSKGDEGKKLPSADKLYIDIGAKDKEQAMSVVKLGDCGVMCSDFHVSGNKVLSKALDDRVGCAILISLLKNYSKYDFYAVFSTQEEVGLRGAKAAAYTVDPQYAIILEGTTAADIAGVADEKRVCVLGDGAAVSFMDGATLYDKDLYNAAIKSGIKCQTKRAVSGGNNSGAVHLSRGGVRCVAVSVPCRYIHSAQSVCDTEDIDSAYRLAEYLLDGIASGEIV